MAVRHASSGEVINVRPLGRALGTARSHALFKSQRFEISRTVLRAGKSIPPHRLMGEMTVLCLEGSVEVTADTVKQQMHAGQLVCIAAGKAHAIRALEDSSLLVTMLLHMGPGGRSAAMTPANTRGGSRPSRIKEGAEESEGIKHVIETGLPPGISVEDAQDPGSQPTDRPPHRKL